VSERWDGPWVIYPKAHTVADSYHAEKLVQYLGHKIAVDSNGKIVETLFRGALPIPHRLGTFSYKLRVSGPKEKDIIVDLVSLADGSVEVDLVDDKTAV
jgi:hypothetical protein